VASAVVVVGSATGAATSVTGLLVSPVNANAMPAPAVNATTTAAATPMISPALDFFPRSVERHLGARPVGPLGAGSRQSRVCHGHDPGRTVSDTLPER
jgi:hypothetical protein